MTEEKRGTSVPGPSLSNYRNFQRNAMGINDRTTRLPSIRSPRDLTLGSSTTKRVFVPNIPVRREKRAKPEEKKESIVSEPPKSEAKKADNKKPIARPRFQREYVSVPGAMFGEGIAPAIPKKGSGAPTAETQSHASGSKTKKETEKTLLKKKKIEPDNIDDAYLSDNFIDDDQDDVHDSNQTCPCAIPMNVPFADSFVADKFDKYGLPIEPPTESESKCESKTTVKQEVISPTHTRNSEPPSVESLFSGLNLNSESQPILFKFPNNCEFPSTEGEPSTSKESISKKIGSILDFSEGCIGKLQRLRSGKLRFLIDGMYFDVVTDIANPMHQEVAAVQKEGEETCITELGQIRNVCECVPCIGKMLPQTFRP